MATIFPHRIIKTGNIKHEFKMSKYPALHEFYFEGKSYNIAQFLSDTETTGIIILKNETILKEDYFKGMDKNSLHISWSLNKSVISALVGIAVNEGYIQSINEPLINYLPELKDSGYRDANIKNILQMSSGVHFNEDYSDFFSDINKMGRVIALGSSINEFAARLEKENEPGTQLSYVSMDTQILGWLIQRAVNVPLSQYLSDKLWKPLGMRSNAKWLVDDYGMELAFGTLNATLRDYARFGLLYLNEGRWNNQQLIPREWIKLSTNPDKEFLQRHHELSSGEYGYGFQWWLPPGKENDFLGRGVYGQYLYVYPEKQIVIVKTSADPNWKANSTDNLMTIALFRQLANHYSQHNP